VSGVYHLSAAGETSWYGFASAIFEGLGIQAEMEPVTTRGYPTRAPRPQYSVLSNEKVVRAFGCRLPPWDVQLREALERTP
jgi:dTDP-4-dehydrorhamnose reductase